MHKGGPALLLHGLLQLLVPSPTHSILNRRPDEGHKSFKTSNDISEDMDLSL